MRKFFLPSIMGFVLYFISIFTVNWVWKLMNGFGRLMRQIGILSIWSSFDEKMIFVSLHGALLLAAVLLCEMYYISRAEGKSGMDFYYSFFMGAATAMPFMFMLMISDMRNISGGLGALSLGVINLLIWVSMIVYIVAYKLVCAMIERIGGSTEKSPESEGQQIKGIQYVLPMAGLLISLPYFATVYNLLLNRMISR